jgi:hypothetical protein
MKLRAVLKKNKFIYNLNAALKAAKTRRASLAVSRHYENIIRDQGIVYDPHKIPLLIKKRIGQRTALTGTGKEKIRIFWVGASKEQDYSGFMQGLQKFGAVVPFKNRHDLYGQEFTSQRYDPRIIENNSIQLINQVENCFKKGEPIDVLLGQMWANFISVKALQQVQKMGVITLNIAMDDRLPELWQTYHNTLLGSIGLADGLDLVLTSCPDCCIRYLAHDCPAIFWPMASDPDLFKPAEKKDIDVCFVGNNYGNRGDIIRQLQKNGIQVEAYGAGWSNGYIGPDKIADVFGRSKIILGIGTIAYNKDIYTLKLRDFDATMAGALYITHRNPDLLKIFTEGKEIECYLTEEEAILKILFYLKHQDLREQIAASAAVVARKYHTWELRLGEAFGAIGFT